MPIGIIPSTNRLGVSNLTIPFANSFVATVLKLPTGSPIYQQQLVHSITPTGGPVSAAYDWLCAGLDSASEASNISTIREVSAHDFRHGRRNLTGAPGANLDGHSNTNLNQIYYFCNEPEAPSNKLVTPNGPCVDTFAPGFGGWDIRDKSLDPYIPGLTLSNFYNPSNPLPATNSTPVAKALGYAYLNLRKQIRAKNRGHILLPPAAVNVFDVQNPNGISLAYWTDFFGVVHNTGVAPGVGSETPLITRDDLLALNVHLYSSNPENSWFVTNGVTPTPRTCAAIDATRMRRGIDWYRTTYCGGASASVPLDVVISEAGPDFSIEQSNPVKYQAGGFGTLFHGLSYWNTWLSYLMRNAAGQLNLTGWQAGSHTVSALMHQADHMPFAASFAPPVTQNQAYFNFVTSGVGVYPSAPAFNTGVGASPPLPGYGRYPGSYTSYGTGAWFLSQPWYRTAYGSCLYTWAKVGSLAVTENINTGWISNTSYSGLLAQGTVTLPGSGYSTVYIPFIKDTSGDTVEWNDFHPDDVIEVWWQGDNGAFVKHGIIRMTEIEDSMTQSFNGISQTMYSAMVLPIVVYSQAAQTRTFRLIRTTAPTNFRRVWIAPPQVMQGMCSWMITPDF